VKDGLAFGLEAGFRILGVELGPTDVKEIELPASGRKVEVPQLHPVWGIDGPGINKIAGVPGKFRVIGPPAIDGHGPEVAAAVAAHAGLGADAWWTNWGAPTTGVPDSAEAGRERSEPLPELAANVVVGAYGDTERIISGCDARTRSEGTAWRRVGNKQRLTGGVWDVVVFDGTLPVRFVECKLGGEDVIQDKPVRSDAGGAPARLG
jgi:hypothetical protein